MYTALTRVTIHPPRPRMRRVPFVKVNVREPKLSLQLHPQTDPRQAHANTQNFAILCRHSLANTVKHLQCFPRGGMVVVLLHLEGDSSDCEKKGGGGRQPYRFPHPEPTSFLKMGRTRGVVGVTSDFLSAVCSSLL